MRPRNVSKRCVPATWWRPFVIKRSESLSWFGQSRQRDAQRHCRGERNELNGSLRTRRDQGKVRCSASSFGKWRENVNGNACRSETKRFLSGWPAIPYLEDFFHRFSAHFLARHDCYPIVIGSGTSAGRLALFRCIWRTVRRSLHGILGPLCRSNGHTPTKPTNYAGPDPMALATSCLFSIARKAAPTGLPVSEVLNAVSSQFAACTDSQRLPRRVHDINRSSSRCAAFTAINLPLLGDLTMSLHVPSEIYFSWQFSVF